MSRNKQKNKKNKNTTKAKSPQQAQSPAINQTQSASPRKEASGASHWHSYGLDQIAQKLVLDAIAADKDCLNQSHKMRMAVAYGLERFWGEHLRLRNSKKDVDRKKSDYWKATWDELVRVMDKAGVSIPNHVVAADDRRAILTMSEALWQLDIEVQRVSLAVLTQLCDCIVWWTQRYKGVQ